MKGGREDFFLGLERQERIYSGNLTDKSAPTNNFFMVEKMLIHHFEAETRGFQGLVDQNGDILDQTAL